MQRVFVLCVVACVWGGVAALWPGGVVHYAIDEQYYDAHSREVIARALSELQTQLCVRFFAVPTPTAGAGERSAGRGTERDQVLLITNSHNVRLCQPQVYNFTGDIVEMAVGFDCVTTRAVARLMADMLRASAAPAPGSSASVNSFDLVRLFQSQGGGAGDAASLISAADRNYINQQYAAACGARSQPRINEAARRADSSAASDVDKGALRLTADNRRYYRNKLWPLGVVLYDVDAGLLNSVWHRTLRRAMTAVELVSCVVFERAGVRGARGLGAELRARSLLWFGRGGADAPQLGFREGNQSISLERMAEGASASESAARALYMVMRALGLVAVSNRHDRDYYVDVHWNNVKSGKEHFLERAPAAASLGAEYDFESGSHAPANFMCADCSRGQTTLQPTHDHLWQRTLSMGRSGALSVGDGAALRALYAEPCQARRAMPAATA